MPRKMITIASILFAAILFLWICYPSEAYVGIGFSSPSPRIIAMGGAYVAVADDANAVFLNPAGLGRNQNDGISIGYGSLLVNRKEYYYAGLLRIGNFGYIGTGYRLDKIDNLSFSVPVTTESAQDLNDDIAISYGFKALDSLLIGLKFHRISEQIDAINYKGDAYGLSMGLLLHPINQLSIGTLFENIINTNYKYSNGVESKIYPNVVLGLSYQSIDNRSILATDLNVKNIGNNAELQSASIGAEIRIFTNLSFRAGYLSSKDNNYQATGSAGLGINILNNLQIDIAVQHTGERKYVPQYFSIGYRF